MNIQNGIDLGGGYYQDPSSGAIFDSNTGQTYNSKEEFGSYLDSQSGAGSNGSQYQAPTTSTVPSLTTAYLLAHGLGDSSVASSAGNAALDALPSGELSTQFGLGSAQPAFSAGEASLDSTTSAPGLLSANSPFMTAGTETFGAPVLPVTAAIAGTYLLDRGLSGVLGHKANTALGYGIRSVAGGFGWPAIQAARGLLAGGKSKDQTQRDGIRGNIQSLYGLKKGDYNLNGVNIGIDGKGLLPNGQKSYNVNFNDPGVDAKVRSLIPLGILLAGKTGKAQDDAVGMIYNAYKDNPMDAYTHAGLDHQTAWNAIDKMSSHIGVDAANGAKDALDQAFSVGTYAGKKPNYSAPAKTAPIVASPTIAPRQIIGKPTTPAVQTTWIRRPTVTPNQA
jgi:hypothetical protein